MKFDSKNKERYFISNNKIGVCVLLGERKLDEIAIFKKEPEKFKLMKEKKNR